MIGVPAGNFSLPGSGLAYYLVMLKPAGEGLGGALQVPFEGLRLGQQLGQGPALLAPPPNTARNDPCFPGSMFPHPRSWAFQQLSLGRSSLWVCCLACAQAGPDDALRRVLWPRLQRHLRGSEGGSQGALPCCGTT